MEVKAPIFITGCARSGTSMTAGAIYNCGAWGGDLYGPNRFNKKGMYENQYIRNEIIKPFLKKYNWDPLGQFPLPNIRHVKEFPDETAERLRTSVLNIMAKQGLQDQPWFFKEAKLCLLWPLWHKAFPEAKWIIVRREAEDIVSSCLRTSFMRAYKKRSGWLRWVAAHESRFEEMIEAKLTVREIWPQRMVRGDFSEIQACANDYGLTYNEKEVLNFIDPGLWRGWESRRRQGWQQELIQPKS